jgi:hypothetical protein
MAVGAGAALIQKHGGASHFQRYANSSTDSTATKKAITV